ncbi:MAG: tetratricopeptide repeat protein [Sedimentisphaerales bacterium]|nr:tetratricopeptide repeat protein [Sedimentisphaerales bacterium]
MMRFSNLEFGDKRDERSAKTPAGEDIRDAEYFHKQALRYWLAGDFEVALRNYSRALEQNSVFYPGWLGQVQMLIELGEYKEAAVWVDKALEMFPEHPELLSAKAVACARDGRMEKAIAYSDESITKENVTARVWLARAEVMLSRKSSIAQNCISKAVSAACGEEGLIIRLQAGRLLNQNGDYAFAMQFLRTLVDELPKSALAWYELGCCQAGLGRPEAKASFEQALKLRPDWAAADEALKKFNARGFFSKFFGR